MLIDENRQSIIFNLTHRIGEREPIRFGFRDAGRNTLFDYTGRPLTPPQREIIVAKSPDEDPSLKKAIDTARAAIADMTETETIDWLNDYIGRLLKVNDPRANRSLLDQIAGEGGARGVEISLGQLIEAGTGVCRHRSLLFKILADQLGLSAALVRGNYVGRGNDGRTGPEDIRVNQLSTEATESDEHVAVDATKFVYISRERSGHAWNEVVLECGERILVDVMHNFATDLRDPQIASYSDVRNISLYPLAGTAREGLPPPQHWAENSSKELTVVRTAPWVSVKSPSGGRSGYIYLDAMSEAKQRALHDALKRLAIHCDQHATSFKGGGKKRNVVRVRGAAYLLLQRSGAKLDHSAPPKTTKAA